jgi:hypothetical protein
MELLACDDKKRNLFNCWMVGGTFDTLTARSTYLPTWKCWPATIKKEIYSTVGWWVEMAAGCFAFTAER